MWAGLLLAIVTVNMPADALAQDAACDSRAHEVPAPLAGTWHEYTVTPTGLVFEGELTSSLEAGGCAFVQAFVSADGTFTFRSLGYVDDEAGAWIERFVLSSGRTATYQWERDGADILLNRTEPDPGRFRLRVTEIQRDSYAVIEERRADDSAEWRQGERTLTRRVPKEGMLSTEAIDAWFTRVAEERGFSGVVLIARGPDVLLKEGYGLADDAGTAMTAETVMLTGSISKQFTATAVLLLAEDGLLDVNDSISAHLEGVPADKTGITIHHLLTHTAGFTQDHFRGDLTPMAFDEALQAIYAQPLGFEPGSKFDYSNTGYTVLAAIAQAVSGRPFVELVRERVFERFGLSSTGFFGNDWTHHSVATTYFNRKSQGPPSAFPGPFWGNMGNAGVMSTAGDLHRWMLALRAGEVVGPENVERLFGRYVEDRPGMHYGYGWSTRESTELGDEVGHGGLGLGGNSEIAFFPDHDLTAIVLSNRARYRYEDGKVVEASLPAREALNQLRANLASGDFSALPTTTRPARQPVWVPVVMLLAAAAVLAFVLWRRRGSRGVVTS